MGVQVSEGEVFIDLRLKGLGIDGGAQAGLDFRGGGLHGVDHLLGGGGEFFVVKGNGRGGLFQAVEGGDQGVAQIKQGLGGQVIDGGGGLFGREFEHAKLRDHAGQGFGIGLPGGAEFVDIAGQEGHVGADVAGELEHLPEIGGVARG